MTAALLAGAWIGPGILVFVALQAARLGWHRADEWAGPEDTDR